MKLYLIPLLTLSFLTPISAKQDVVKKAEPNVALSPLEGLWSAISGHEDEDPIDQEEINSIFMRFHGNTIITSFEEEVIIGKFTFKAKKNRIQATLTMDEEKVIIPIIYKIENDQLTICHFQDFEEKPKNYPESFEPAKGLVIVKLKRLPIDNRLKGNWESKELWEMGEMSEDKYVVAFDKYKLSITDVEDPDAELGYYLTNSKTTPKRIHLYSDDGDFQKGIYKIEKEILHICIIEDDPDGKLTDKEGYPKDFVKKEDATYVKLARKK